MYAWIWSKLPGNVWVKSACSFVLAFAFIALLWFVVFPWLKPLLPFDDINLENGTPGETNTHENPDGFDISYDINETPTAPTE